MDALRDRIRTRLVPALLVAGGVTLIGAGLLSYTGPADAAFGSPDPSIAVAESPTAAPASPATGSPAPSSSLPASPAPSASFPADRVATRVVIPALRIDLPIVAGTDSYPYCNVAQYLTDLGQPGEGRATYLYGHARTGMFLPLLRTADAKLLHVLVEVYTSDDMVFLYEITEVRRHQLDLNDAASATTEQLWLQTSEGPKGTKPKTQVVAMPLSSGPADPKDAHPTPKPVVCG